MNALIPHPSDFAHASKIHGQAHVGRVMIHAFRLIEATGMTEEASRLWGAVYLHELARTHDGFDEVHGMHYGEFANYAEYFAQALLAGLPFSPDLEEGLETFCVLEAIRQSAQTSRPMPVEPLLVEIGLRKG